MTPVIVGVVAVVVTGVIVKLIFGRSKKRRKTLIDPAVKYPLKLVDKMVTYYLGT